MTIAFIVLLIAFGFMANANRILLKLNKRLIKDTKYLMECLDAAKVLYASDVYGKKHDD
jgi:hypothetical protein